MVPNTIDGKNLSLRFSKYTYVNVMPCNVDIAIPTTDPSFSPLAEDGYYRETTKALRLILKKHNELSNRFCLWLRNHGTIPSQEKDRIDVFFRVGTRLFLAELKTCHGIGTTRSIREALGQLFEYNHYGNRTTANDWLIILDQTPSSKDREYVQRIRSSYNLPLNLGWNLGDEFRFLR